MSQGFTGKNFTFQRWDGLYHPIKNLSLSMSTFTTTYNWATGTSTNNLISLTTDASANGTGALLFVGTGASSTVLPLLVKSGSTTALTVNTSAQVLIGTLSSGRITYAGASGLLQDSANMTFDGNRIALATTGNTGGLLIGGDTTLYRSSANVLATDDAFNAASVFSYGNVVAEGGYVSSGLGGGGSLGQFRLLGDSSGTITIQPQTDAGTYNFNLPITAGTSGHVLTSGGGGATAMTWTDPASLAVRWNSIVAPNGNQSLTMSTHTTTWNWATGTSTNNLFNLTTDASANGTGALLRIATGSSATVVPLLVLAGATTALTVNASAQVLIGTLSSGRITYAGSSGLLQDSANMTFDGNRISLATTGSSGGLLIGGDANLYRSAADVLKTDDSFVVGTNLTVSTMTLGSLLFAGTSGLVSQDNSNLFWDDTNNTLGVGTTRTGAISGTNPSVRIIGTGISSATSSFEIRDSSSGILFFVRNDRQIGIGTNTPTAAFQIDASIATIAMFGSGGVNNVTISAANPLHTGSAGSLITGTGEETGGLQITGDVGISLNTTTGGSVSVWYNGSQRIDMSNTAATLYPHGISAGNTYELVFMELVANGSNYLSFKAPDNIGTTVTHTLPSDVPAAGEFLKVTSYAAGAAVLEWSTATATVSIGGAVTSGTTGSVLFVGAGPVLAQDNANFFWDDTNNTFGIGTTRTGAISATNPSMRILGTGTTSSTSSFEVQDSGASTILFVRDDGRVGVGNNAPSAKLHVSGNVTNSAWAFVGVGLQLAAATYTDSSTAGAGTATNAAIHSIAQPTLAATNSTVTTTNAATLYIAGSPANGTNMTITNPYALWVGDGANKYDAASALTSGTFTHEVSALTFTGGAGSAAMVGKSYVLTLSPSGAQTGSATGTYTEVAFGTSQTWSAGALVGHKVLMNMSGGGATSVASVYGGQFIYQKTGANTLTNAYGLLVQQSGTHAGTTTTYNGLRIEKNYSAGTITTSYGIYLQQVGNLGAGTTNGASIFMESDGTAKTGLVWGTASPGDTNLYRSAADTLKTDDAFIAIGGVTAGTLTSGRVVFAGTSGLLSDSANFTYTTGTGQLALATSGSGAGILIGGDTQLYRRAADIMSMAASDSFEVPSGFVGFGTTAPTSGARVNITYNATVGSGTERAVLFTGTVSAAHTGFYNINQSEGSTTNSTGTVNWIAGALNRIRAQSTGGTVTSIYGLHNMAWMDSASGTMTYSINIGVQCEALWSNTAFTGTATVTSNIALNASNAHVTLAGGGTVNIASEYGLNVQASVNTGIVITTRYGIRINDPTGSTGTLTTQYGLYFEDLDRAGTNYGLYFAGTSGLSRQGIWWNADTNLYRSAADTLRTDDAFISGSTITGASSLTLGANGGTIGSILLRGNTSGTVTVIPAAAAGTWTFTLPTTGGTSGYVLQTNGSGTTTWAAPGVAWTEVTGTSTTAVAHNGYVANNAAQVVITRPTPAIGSVVEIVGLGAGGWRALCASGHTIRLGTIVSASTGYAESTNRYDSIRIVGISATAWSIVSVVGTLDVV